MVQANPVDSVLDVMKTAIYAVEINKSSFNRVQRKLQDIKPDYWKENTDAQEYLGIKNFPKLAAGLKDSLQMPENEYKELMLMHNLTESGKVNKLEVEFDSGELETRYVFFAMLKKGSATDLVYALYTLKARAAPKTEKVKIDTIRKSYLWGLFKKEIPVYEDRVCSPGLETIQQDPERNAFFRYQAINGIADKGLVDRSKLNIVE